MRVLLIAVTYLTRVNQKKPDELAALPGVELQVIVPTMWRETLHPTLPVQIPNKARYSFVPIPTFLTGRGGRYCYRTLDLTMREFHPDIIQIEEGWRGLTTFQAEFYRRIWAPRARSVIFSWENMVRPLPSYQLLFQSYNLRHTDHLICGNQDGVTSVRAAGYRGSVSVIPQLGVDTEEFYRRDGSDTRNRLGFSSKTFVIGFAARMVREKGLLHLLEAVAQLQGDWALLLIGSGPDRDRAMRRAQELSIASRIQWVGTVPHLELAQYYNAMDVLVSPSVATLKWKEQYGLVVLQAMNSQVPVIGSTCGETPHVIGDAGLIFQEGDVEALVERLRRLQTNPSLRAELGRRGYERVQAHYTFRSIAAQTYQVWKGLMNG
ncbi:MAG: glycosyltransferase family 4 protein [Candidatus Atribacteria bacterium]|nr:glycosyltransferase family 4 protein [Candidatus Atribacteria bacterium]